jgi:hypothetical protein
MSYKPGSAVIVSQDGINRVGVVLDRYIANKVTVYDVLLENRSAVCMISMNTSNNVFVNRSLSDLLCKTDVITPTIPYKQLLDDELLPITKS